MIIYKLVISLTPNGYDLIEKKISVSEGNKTYKVDIENILNESVNEDYIKKSKINKIEETLMINNHHSVRYKVFCFKEDLEEYKKLLDEKVINFFMEINKTIGKMNDNLKNGFTIKVRN